MIPHFQNFPPHLIQWLEAGVQGVEPPNRPEGPVLPPSLILPSSAPGPPIIGPPSVQSSLAVPKTTVTTTSASTSAIVRPTTTSSGAGRLSIANTTNIDTLLAARQSESGEEIVNPSEAEQDKIAFIFNNLSVQNLTNK